MVGDQAQFVLESTRLYMRDEEHMSSHRRMQNKSHTAADCKPAQITVAGFNLTGSFEEFYLSVSKETLSWPPGDTTLYHTRENPR